VRVLIASGARFDPGPARGRVTPEIVGPRTAQDATLVLPGDRDWGVWVDTGDGPNLYFLASDFPIGATGRAPSRSSSIVITAWASISRRMCTAGSVSDRHVDQRLLQRKSNE